MAKVKWPVDADGNWSLASNWSGSVLPNGANDVTISTAHVHTITHESGSDVVHSLTVGNDHLNQLVQWERTCIRQANDLGLAQLTH